MNQEKYLNELAELTSKKVEFIRELDYDLEICGEDHLWRAHKYEQLATIERAIHYLLKEEVTS